MKKLIPLFTVAFLAVTVIMMSSNQLVAQTSIINGNEYAFSYSGIANPPVPPVGFGLYFNQNNPAPARYEFKDNTGGTVWSTEAVSGKMWSAGNILTDGDVVPAGDLVPGGALQVGANKYAFQYIAGGVSTQYGLFFSLADVAYQFKTGTGANMFSIGANSGDGEFAGNLGVGTAPSSALDVFSDDALGQRGLSVAVAGPSPSGVGQTASIERTDTVGPNNDILQLVAPAGSSDNFQFIEAERGFDIKFAVQGDGSIDFDGALRPGLSAGTLGQVLTSQGAGAAPIWAAGGGGGADSDWSGAGSGDMYVTTATDQVGIGTSFPNSKLHVNGDGVSPSLRVQVSGSSKLVVDPNGGTSIGIFGATPPANGLLVTGDAVFSLDATVAGNVGIGTTAPAYPLHVEAGEATYGIYANHDATTTGPKYGLNIDLDNTFTGSGNTYGARIDGYKIGGGGTVYGIHSAGRNYNTTGVASATFGAYGYAYRSSATPASTTYAIYGLQSGSAAIEYAGYFSGDVYSTGAYLPSDAILKTEVDVFEGGIEQLAQIETKVYNYKTSEYPHFNFPEGQQIGLMADNLKEVFPQLVKSSHQPEVIVPLEDAIDMGADYTPVGDDMAKIADGLDYDVVNYTGLIPVLVNAVQEQQAEIEDKDDLIEELQAENAAQNEQIAQIMEMLTHIDNSMGNCCTSYRDFEPATQPAINDDKAQLMQNVPNPFNSSTLIRYYLPNDVQRATMSFYDASGVELNSRVLTNGHGQILFNDSQLASGTYFYSMMVDGKVLETKRMVLLK